MTIATEKKPAVLKIKPAPQDGVNHPKTMMGLVYGGLGKIESVDQQILKLWIQNITITMGLVNTNTTPMLLKTVSSGKIEPKKLITHHFKLDEIMKAYEVFSNAGKEKAMKVILTNE